MLTIVTSQNMKTNKHTITIAALSTVFALGVGLIINANMPHTEADASNYSVNTATKINGFSLSGYRPGREVIYIILYDKQNFDEEYFISQIMSAFNIMIPDSALVWEEEKAV